MFYYIEGLFVEPTENNYNVLNTDYENYAVVYSCEPLPDKKRKDNLWVLTRDPLIIPSDAKSAIDFSVDKYFDRSVIRVTRHGQV